MGNFNTYKADNLMVVFEKCNPDDHLEDPEFCKSDEEIIEWFDGKYILSLENEKRFI